MKTIKSNILSISLTLLLAVMVGVVYAAVMPRNLTYRAGARLYTTFIGNAVAGDVDVPVFMAPFPGRLTRAWISTTAGVTPADTVTNYWDIYLISYGAPTYGTAGTATDTLAYFSTLHTTHTAIMTGISPAADAVRGLGISNLDTNTDTIPTAKNYMSAGEMVELSIDEAATCTSLGQVSLFIEFLPVGLNGPKGTPTAGSDQ